MVCCRCVIVCFPHLSAVKNQQNSNILMGQKNRVSDQGFFQLKNCQGTILSFGKGEAIFKQRTIALQYSKAGMLHLNQRCPIHQPLAICGQWRPTLWRVDFSYNLIFVIFKLNLEIIYLRFLCKLLNGSVAFQAL